MKKIDLIKTPIFMQQKLIADTINELLEELAKQGIITLETENLEKETNNDKIKIEKESDK